MKLLYGFYFLVLAFAASSSSQPIEDATTISSTTEKVDSGVVGGEREGRFFFWMSGGNFFFYKKWFYFPHAYENFIPDPCQSVGAIFFGGDFKCTLACLARGSPQGGYCDDDNACQCNVIE